jgi:hypothetical protein
MIRKVVLTTLVALFAISIFSQVASVQAFHTPITGPITTPITFFNLTGEVTLKQFGKLFGGLKRFMPAEDVTVKVTGLFDKNKKFTTETDEQGDYGFMLPAGHYLVEVEDDPDTFFAPPIKFVHIKEGKVKTADFKGFVFP